MLTEQGSWATAEQAKTMRLGGLAQTGLNSQGSQEGDRTANLKLGLGYLWESSRAFGGGGVSLVPRER